MNDEPTREELEQAVDDGDLYYCATCLDLNPGRHCPKCHAGACAGCGWAIPKGEGAETQVIPRETKPPITDLFCKRCTS